MAVLLGYCDVCNESKDIKLFSSRQVKSSYRTKSMTCKKCMRYQHNAGINIKIDSKTRNKANDLFKFLMQQKKVKAI